MTTTDPEHLLAWSEPLVSARRLTLHPIPEGWLAALDGFPMSYGETPGVAVMWTFLMSHKSAYE